MLIELPQYPLLTCPDVVHLGKHRKFFLPLPRLFLTYFSIICPLSKTIVYLSSILGPVDDDIMMISLIILNPNSKKDKACTKTGHNTVQTCLENAKCVDDNQKKQSNDINIMIQSIARKIHKYLFKKIIFNIIRFYNLLSIINFHVSL